MTVTSRDLPHWDMSVVYPALDSAEFERGFAAAAEAIEELAALFDRHGVGEGDSPASSAEALANIDALIERFNAVLQQVNTLDTYIYCHIATDSRDALAQAKLSVFDRHDTRLAQLATRFTAWIGTLDVETLIAGSEQAAEHAFTLREAKQRARRLMSPGEEALAAELNVTGGAAWVKLHGNLSSQVEVTVERDGEMVTMPMSEARNLAHEPDRALRQRAFEAEVGAWETVALPLATALNGIKGQVNTLSARRGWETPLDETLFQNRIDRATLEAMLEAARESFPQLRRYLRAKARALKLPALAWHDLFAPMGAEGRVWEWEESRDFLIGVFSDYSPGMGAFTERSFRESWIDAEPRPGKQDGGLCLSLPDGTSRITVNFTPTFMGVRQLAHELGHAYHNHLLIEGGRSMWQWSETPATLAETAAIFCETLVREAVLEGAHGDERLFILDATLQNSCRFIVDGMASFRFEERMLNLRRTRELSVAELNALVLECQRETFGDALDPDALHPYMWAYRPHAFVPDTSHGAIPYMFGQLFSGGLFARYQAELDTFPAKLDTLLASASTADIPTLASSLGVDLRDEAFWQASVDMMLRDIDWFTNEAQ